MKKDTKLNNLITAIRAVFMPWSPGPLGFQFGEDEPWEEAQKARYPIRWFLFDTVPLELSVWRMRLNNIKWEILYRVAPQHRYHTIRTSLKPGYWDPDTRILYAIMDTIKEFVEETEHTIAWDDGEEHTKANKELQEIYKWWTVDYPARKAPELPEELKHLSWENSEAWKELSDKEHKQEQEWLEEENDMLIRAIKVRQYLWYP